MIRLWNSKEFTYGQLAKKLTKDFGVDLNRNKISGRLNRAREAGQEVWSPGGPSDITKKPTERKPRERAPRPDKPKKSMVRLAPTPLPDEASIGHMTWEQAHGRRNLCKYPYGNHPDTTFCGAPAKENSSYCHDHHAKCYKPVDEVYDDRKMARWFK